MPRHNQASRIELVTSAATATTTANDSTVDHIHATAALSGRNGESSGATRHKSPAFVSGFAQIQKTETQTTGYQQAGNLRNALFVADPAGSGLGSLLGSLHGQIVTIFYRRAVRAAGDCGSHLGQAVRPK